VKSVDLVMWRDVYKKADYEKHMVIAEPGKMHYEVNGNRISQEVHGIILELLLELDELRRKNESGRTV
jgi:hypothetical protein